MTGGAGAGGDGVGPRVTTLPAPPLPPGRPRLVVTGFMGTGKTTAGGRAADLLGLPFFDLDEVVQARAGASASAIFAREGEAAFRELERRAVEDAARLSGTVVATGGGAVLDRGTFGRLAEGSVVAVLTCEPDRLAHRLRDAADRPLLSPDVRVRTVELLRERADAYAAAGEPLDTTSLGAEEAAAELAARYRRVTPAGPARVRVPGPTGGCEVVVGAAALDVLGAEVAAALPDARTAAVVADGAVGAVAERVAAALAEAGLRVVRVDLPAGEAAKAIGVAGEAWTRLREAGLERGDAVVAVGGGAALDAAGFVAATYARGVPLVNVPTTLLAMVDAAVGGKVAIDHGGVKNLVGAFHHPRLVVADTETLGSLPRRSLRAGLAEAVKAFLLASPMALERLEGADPLDAPDGTASLGWVVEQAVRVKAAFVGQDPEDRGARHALNLGHTFAHALEAASGYALPHGEAVAVGLVAAARLGAAVGITSGDLADRIAALLSRLGLPTAPPPSLGAERLLSAMAGDKKRRGGPVFVVPAAGGAALVEGVDPRRALDALQPLGLSGPST